MTRRRIIATLAASAAPAAAQAASGWKNTFAEQLKNDFIAHWKSTAEYSLDCVDAMPAEHFGFRPTDEQRTFAEQLAHFARGNVGYFSSFKKGPKPPTQPAGELTKINVREFVEQSFEYSLGVLENLTEADFMRRDIAFNNPNNVHTAQDIFLRGYMHTAHHRGQVVAYLRLKNTPPPAWRFPPNGEA